MRFPVFLFTLLGGRGRWRGTDVDTSKTDIRCSYYFNNTMVRNCKFRLMYQDRITSFSLKVLRKLCMKPIDFVVYESAGNEKR